MPGLESVSPSIRSHLVHLARTLAADEEFIAGELGTRARWIDPWDPQGGIPVRLDSRDARAAPNAMAARPDIPHRTRESHPPPGGTVS